MKHLFDDVDKNKYESYTKEEVLEVIQEAISSGELPEEINGLVLTFKNPIDNLGYKIAFCTQAKYNELKAAQQLELNCLYYIIDDNTFDNLEEILQAFQDQLDGYRNEMDAYMNTIDEHIQTGLRMAITSINSDFTFYDWHNSQTGSGLEISSGSDISKIQAGYSVLPSGTSESIAETKIERISGDDGYIQYRFASITTSGAYFIAKNISSDKVYGANYSDAVIGATTVVKSTTFRLTVKDLYNNVYTKDFTISFKVKA